MKILAIETSCDETAIALVEAAGGLRQPSFKVLKNIISSQVKIHRPFGGVVPSLAKREHLKNLPVVLSKVLGTNNLKLITNKLDLIAVTVGPGLEPALWTGINFAKELAKKHKKPLIGINHLEGHLYSFLLTKNLKLITDNLFPAIVLIVSGGHTILVCQKDLTHWKKIGETRDDAAGEAFDKVARLLGLPYPGGAEIEKLAARLAQGKHPKGTIEFPRPMIYQKNYDFSFSGLKTAVLYYIRDAKLRMNANLRNEDRRNIAASFQQAIIDVLVSKTIRATNEHKARSVILAGGVASNSALQKRLRTECRKNKLNFLSAERKYQTDNAAMIATAAYINYLEKRKHRLTAQASLNL